MNKEKVIVSNQVFQVTLYKRGCFLTKYMVEVPRDIRLERVRNRSFMKFGNGCFQVEIYMRKKNSGSNWWNQDPRIMQRNALNLLTYSG